MRRRLLSLLLVFVMVLGMLPVSAFADAPFTVTVGGTQMTEIAESTLTWTSWDGSTSEVACYTVTVPAGSTAATLTFTETKQWSYYDSKGEYIGAGESSWTAATEHTVDIVDSNADGELDGISVQIPGAFSAEYFILFAYASSGDSGSGSETPTTPTAPFLSIKIGDTPVAEENIVSKGIFQLGDAFEGDDDGYNYIHEVPYYHVTVPCGTASVDVTYSADTNIMNSGSDAYGYKTDLTVDAVSSATVRGTTFKNGYTKHEDGTQTVTTPVTGYTFDADGNGHAITLEEPDSPFAAVCLFSFEYDGVNHVYDAGVVTTDPTCTQAGEKTFTCSCGASYTEEVAATGEHDYQNGTCVNCGGADPDYVAPGGAVIPEGAPFTALETDQGNVGQITPMDNAETSSYGNVPYYHVTIPAAATEVYVTHPTSEKPFCDANYNSAYGYAADTETWTTSGMSFAFTAVEGGYKVALPLSTMVDTDMDWNPDTEASFVADENGSVTYAVAVERDGTDGDYSPICFFTFERAAAAEGEHVHSYDAGVVTTAPTCTEKGVKTFTCSGCTDDTEGHSYTEEIPAAGHSYDAGVETTPATCVADGVKTFTCSKCAEGTEGHTKTEAIAKLGHSYDTGVETTAPTCTEAGVKTFTCTVCEEGTEGHSYTEAIPVVDHSYGDDKVCDNCGHVDTTPTQIDGVYQIGTYDELLWFAEAVNGGQTAISGVLTADITVDENWPGIGNYSNKFAGDFNGQNHTVTLSGGTWGLFGYTMGANSNHTLTDAATIQNVILDGTVQNSALIHSAGYTHVKNCINKADVTGQNAEVAGIIGSVTGSNKYGQIYSNVRIENCGNEGNIQGDDYTGGILGYTKANTHLDGCYNTGAVSGNGYVGGLVGYLQGSTASCSVKNSYNKGTVTGSQYVAGIVGQQYNSTAVTNCYNAGEAEYAIAGHVYNKTASASNTYYLDSSSDYGVPQYYNNKTSGGFNTTVLGTAVSAATLGSAEFASTLGTSFQASCGGPVFTWQQPVAHNAPNGICTVCKHGDSNHKAHYNAIKSTGAGYEILGEATAQEGFAYTFTVAVESGYASTNMKVTVNGTAVTANEAGEYSVNPTGHFYITVTGVEEIAGIQGINLPRAGNGYRVKPCDGYTTTVETGKDFKFTVECVDGFIPGDQFEVRVNNVTFNPDASGVYTISNIQETKNITVHDVETTDHKSVTVNLTITQGQKDFLVQNNQIIMDKEFTVPYFDLSLYGYEKYYYNPYCYVDANGNAVAQTAGNRETAYNVVTTMHAFIYMTELYKLGYGPDEAGKGHSDQNDMDGDGISDFDEAVSWTQDAGSSFMNLWGLGSNLNYHLNYVYPTGRSEWGSTSDQQALKDGDVLTVHFLTKGSGSAFGVFAVGDEDNTYSGTETKDRATVKQGETVDLTLYWGEQGDKYTTKFVTGGNTDLYWVEKSERSATVDVGVYDEESGEEIGGTWNREGFGNMTAEALKTDANGKITINTTGVEPGTYYLAVQGHFNTGGGNTGDGFQSAGAEAGPAYFQLTVTEGDGTGEEETVVYGDVDGDEEVTSADAAIVYSIYNEVYTGELTDALVRAADVDGDEEITSSDAALIYAYYNAIQDTFPVEAN